MQKFLSCRVIKFLLTHAALALLPRNVIRQPMAPAPGGLALLFVLLAGCGVRSSLAQICNAKDPESGGIVVPAFGTGGAKVCLKDANDTLGLAYVNADGSVCERAKNDPQWFAILYFVLLQILMYTDCWFPTGRCVLILSLSLSPSQLLRQSKFRGCTRPPPPPRSPSVQLSPPRSRTERALSRWSRASQNPSRSNARAPPCHASVSLRWCRA